MLSKIAGAYELYKFMEDKKAEDAKNKYLNVPIQNVNQCDTFVRQEQKGAKFPKYKNNPKIDDEMRSVMKEPTGEEFDTFLKREMRS